MKTRKIIVIGITSALAIGIAIYLSGKTKKDRMLQRLDKIADEGYETAADVLFPLKSPWIKRFRFSGVSGR